MIANADSVMPSIPKLANHTRVRLGKILGVLPQALAAGALKNQPEVEKFTRVSKTRRLDDLTPDEVRDIEEFRSTNDGERRTIRELLGELNK